MNEQRNEGMSVEYANVGINGEDYLHTELYFATIGYVRPRHLHVKQTELKDGPEHEGNRLSKTSYLEWFMRNLGESKTLIQ